MGANKPTTPPSQTSPQQQQQQQQNNDPFGWDTPAPVTQQHQQPQQPQQQLQPQQQNQQTQAFNPFGGSTPTVSTVTRSVSIRIDETGSIISNPFSIPFPLLLPFRFSLYYLVLSVLSTPSPIATRSTCKQFK